ncbi:MAG: alpha/beta fold hydrolase [Actinomycetota bacterium]|nr:alpha/beta fold hydrolase [Actinomycetota bacterium]
MSLFDRFWEFIKWVLEQLIPFTPVFTRPPADCALAWQPSVWLPVFYGVADLAPVVPTQTRGPEGGEPGAGEPQSDSPPDVSSQAGLRGEAGPVSEPPWPAEAAPPTPLRVFYPSLEGSVWDAEILAVCGRYPLVVFLHGHCQGLADGYKSWFVLPAQLARSGYVVVVPHLPNISAGQGPFGGTGDRDLVRRVITWMRTEWQYAGAVLPEPATGVVGHSYGGLLAAQLAAGGDAAALATLSAGWSEWPDQPPNPIFNVRVPTLMVWGTGPGDIYAAADQFWSAVPRPRHKLVNADASHWDYLRPGVPCEGWRGPCGQTRWISMDVVTLFLGKYLPPELWPTLGQQISYRLTSRKIERTVDQEFYAGNHLTGYDGVRSSSTTCTATVSWSTSVKSGSMTFG